MELALGAGQPKLGLGIQLPRTPKRCPHTSDCSGEGVGCEAGELWEPIMYATKEVGDVRIMELKSMPRPSDRGEMERALFLERLDWWGLLMSSLNR